MLHSIIQKADNKNMALFAKIAKKIKIILIQKTISDFFSLTTATLVTSLVSFVVSIFTKRILGPELFGIWLTVSLILNYGILVQMGTLNALNREIPYYFAKKDYNNVSIVRNSVFTFLFTLPAVFCVTLIVLGFILNKNHFQPKFSIGLVLVSIVLFMGFISIFVENSYKSDQNFKFVSKLIFIKSITSAIFTLIFVLVFGYYGLFFGIILASLVEIFIGKEKLKIAAFNWNFNDITDRIKIGFPILLVGSAWTFFVGIDRILIASFLKPIDLGYYGIALLVYTFIMMVPTALGQILYSKLSFRLGISDNHKQFLSIIVKTNMVLSNLVSIIIGLIIVFLPIFVYVVLPQYIPGIISAQILAFGVYPLSVTGVAGTYFIITSQQKINLVNLTITALLNIFISYALLQIMGSIVAVALGTTISYFIYAVLINSKALQILDKHGIAYSFKLFLPLCFVVFPLLVFRYVLINDSVLYYILSSVWIIICLVFNFKKVLSVF